MKHLFFNPLLCTKCFSKMRGAEAEADIANQQPEATVAIDEGLRTFLNLVTFDASEK